MTNVRALAGRRLAKRLHYAGRRETEAQFFERVRRRVRRTELRLGRHEIQWSVGALLAQGTTSVTFPPVPPAEDWDWDWEPPCMELPLRPTDPND